MSDAKRHMRDILESLGDGVVGAMVLTMETLWQYYAQEVGPANLEEVTRSVKRNDKEAI
jgi:hypothetical protein